MFSPDGTQLAYTACEVPCGDYYLRIVPADLSAPPSTARGTGPVVPSSQSWSRDGAYVYVRTEGSGGETFGHDVGGCVMRVSATHPTDVATVGCRPGLVDVGFAQSPDGRSALLWGDVLPPRVGDAGWPVPSKTELTWLRLPDGSEKGRADLSPALIPETPLSDGGLVVAPLGYAAVDSLVVVDLATKRDRTTALDGSSLEPGPWLDDRHMLAVREGRDLPWTSWDLVRIAPAAILAALPR